MIKLSEYVRIYSKHEDANAIEQIQEMIKKYPNAVMRFMPDYHAGAGCVIGTVMNTFDAVHPDVIGNDIGCGVSAFSFKKDLAKDIKDLPEFLDKAIRLLVPSGRNIHGKKLKFPRVYDKLSFELDDSLKDKIDRSLGTLGGGNHFIEVGELEDKYFITVHSGSRALGGIIHSHHKDIYENATKNEINKMIKDMIPNIYPKDRAKMIPMLRETFTKQLSSPSHAMSQKIFNDYVNDVEIGVAFAMLNRVSILWMIISALQLKISDVDAISISHNYIETRHMRNKLVRKGAISAKKDEAVLIPINMRDGIIYGKGKGNTTWFESAPHGAGRVLSRTKAKEQLNVEDFVESMKNVYSTCVNENTLDEAPMAYKPMQEIVDAISDTVEIIGIIKPIYNFKGE
ncbi:MAG: RtcB family protein [Cetobacterium sp.]|uniref:RtcB family protein n=1 Tax=Cetobacterium sp. TaxID=2071632 RepID=UPI003EE48A12